MQKIENETEKFDNHLKINKLQISENFRKLFVFT